MMSDKMTSAIKLLSVVLLIPSVCASQKQEPLDWAKGAVWYQIFPERFVNGTTANDPVKARVVGDRALNWQVSPWTAGWYTLQEWEKERSHNFYDIVFDRRYGGDLVGVIDKLDYLQALGVQVIYFNPIFEAPSLHKYDASTYHHVDNNFGLNREGDWDAMQNEAVDGGAWQFTSADSVFLQLIHEAHERKIRVVIDGVFNHCGKEFWAFQDVVNKQEESKFKSWFDVTSWDDPATPDTNEFDYRGWWGYKNLPEFKEDENGPVLPVREYLFSITRRWMDPNGDGDPSDGVDGWRLDAVDQISPAFWDVWYPYVKSINPNAVTVGEIWVEAGDWIEEGRFDAVKNYPLAKAIVDLFIDRSTAISVSEFDAELARLRALYPAAANHLLINLVDGHDTDRLASMIRNPDRNFDRDGSPRYNRNYDPRKATEDEKRIQKLIVIFQFTYVGAPMIYYGDEAGMWGADDPDDRKPMLWRDMTYENETYVAVRPDLATSDVVAFDPEMFEHYQNLVSIRRENPALQRGEFQTRLVDDERSIYAYTRSYAGNELLVVLNNDSVMHDVNVSAPWEKTAAVSDLLTGELYPLRDGALNIRVAARSGAILAPATDQM